MDFLLDALDEVASEIFWSVAHLPDLDAGIVLVGRAPACWELEVAAGLGEAAARDGGGDEPPEEDGDRQLGRSKDHRDDLPQVVTAMAVTETGSRCTAGPSPATRRTRRSSAR